MQYILAHDLGTSGNKATLFSENGELVAAVTERYPVYYSAGNRAEQDPDDWWNAVAKSTRQLISHIDPADIAAVSFSGQMMGCVCVDKTGRPLRRALIWADMRAKAQEARIREAIDETEFYHLTGHRLSPSYGGQKLMWVRENEPEIYNATYKMLNAKDYIILRLTGEFVTEYTDASSTCLMDLEKLEWSPRLLDAMGIDPEKMPRLCRSTDVAGLVTPEAAKLTGLVPRDARRLRRRGRRLRRGRHRLCQRGRRAQQHGNVFVDLDHGEKADLRRKTADVHLGAHRPRLCASHRHDADGRRRVRMVRRSLLRRGKTDRKSAPARTFMRFSKRF